MKVLLTNEMAVGVEQKRSMVRAHGYQGMKIILREDLLLSFRDERPVNLLKGGVQPLVTPSEEALLQVNFLKHSFIQKIVELAHQSLVCPRIVLVWRLVDHIEITGEEPQSRSNQS
jgi:hypothetical protein